MEIVEGYNVAHATISALESTRTNERFQLLQNNILKTALKLNTAEFMQLQLKKSSRLNKFVGPIGISYQNPTLRLLQFELT